MRMGGEEDYPGRGPDTGDEETSTREKEWPQRSREVAEPEHTRSKGAGLFHLQAEMRGSASSRGKRNTRSAGQGGPSESKQAPGLAGRGRGGARAGERAESRGSGRGTGLCGVGGTGGPGEGGLVALGFRGA